MPKNVKEISVSYDLPKMNTLPSERITRKSSVENNLFLLNMVDNTEMGENWLFSFYDGDGNLIKESSEFAY
ncbi:hypothetical protein [Cytobacillus sp. IB215665]|uniref:hypothetical protein n=1 Tax=Cytobacillus sp. IB215665 TaxID=3097357 RepID=UPI002A0ABD90|nr:hypothetical protein [Cytobacillus sp. IB215665]MDX8365659.1 hypothetical protein [Cytobacillus sp. IB215665]